jgi:hypothetical protein
MRFSPAMRDRSSAFLHPLTPTILETFRRDRNHRARTNMPRLCNRPPGMSPPQKWLSLLPRAQWLVRKLLYIRLEIINLPVEMWNA